jgi:hypothetical protein
MVLDSLGSVEVLLLAQFPVQWFLLFWLVCVAGAAAGWLVVYPYTQRRGPLAQFLTTTRPGAVRWRGLVGVRYPLAQGGTMTATTPMARVTCDDDGVRVWASVPVLRFAVPSWLFRWPDLLVAEAVGGSGVRLRFQAVDAPILLLAMVDRASFFDELETHSVRTNRRPQPSGWWSTR